MSDQQPTPVTERASDRRAAVDGNALDALVPVVYAELHRLAHRHIRRERANHTLQTSALVNEAYLRMAAQRGVDWYDRTQFFATAAQMMRRILVDYARSRGYAKRGAGAVHVSLDHVQVANDEPTAEVAALDEALSRLETIDPQQARVVELRFFGGLTIKETADAMSLSVDMVKREWSTAKAWLYREMSYGSPS